MASWEFGVAPGERRMAKLVSVLTCDVIGSGKIEEIQYKIATGLSRLNREKSKLLLTPFEVTIGDEFQGIVKNPEDTYDVYLRLADLTQFPLYGGCGLGRLTLRKLKSIHAREMTGVPFIRSRMAIGRAKAGRFEFVAVTGSEDRDFTINVLTRAAQFIKAHRTRRQNKIIESLERNPEQNQAEVATRLKISASTMSQILKYAGYEETKEIAQAVKFLLGQLIAEIQDDA